MSETSDHRWVEQPEALAELSTALATTHELALDTESNSMFAYRERMCLVQLNLVDHTHVGTPRLFAIDPLAFESPGEATSPLVEWLAFGRRVLLHGGEYDVAVMKRELGTSPTNLFDTQAAAAMLGFARTGYANLCGELLDVKLTKEHQQFDWARRPVPAGPRRYALDDVRYLPALARALEARVRTADLEEEVAIACLAVSAAAPHEGMDASERFWRVVGGERLPRDVLARVASLVVWREAEAEQRDQPPGRLVSKESLLNLARRGATSARELETFGLSRRLVAERADSLLVALATPGEVPDKPRRIASDPIVEARRSRLKSWRDDEAKRREVTIQAVLPTRALESLALGETELGAVPQLGDKRIRLYGERLRQLAR